MPIENYINDGAVDYANRWLDLLRFVERMEMIHRDTQTKEMMYALIYHEIKKIEKGAK